MYALASDELFLVGTAEVPLASMHGGETLAEGDLPLHYVGFSTLLPARGGRRRQGHARHLPRPPVRQARALQLLPPRHVVGRARAPARDRGGNRPGAGLPLPGGRHPGRRPRRVGGAEVRHRGVAPRPGALPRADVVLELHRLPGPPAQHPLPPGRRKAPVRAHAERHRDHLQPHAARADRVWPAGRRVDPHPRCVASVWRPRRDRPQRPNTRRC